MEYLRRGSGFFIDVGASQLIIAGEVNLVKGQVNHSDKNVVVLAVGTRLEADLDVMATGFGSING